MREQGLKDLFEEERDLFQGIKLMSDLLKKINEPFAKVWAKLTNSIVLIEEDMRDILNNFNEFRQQTLNNPRTADEEKEDLLNNPYGRTMKGGSLFGYKITLGGVKKKGGGYWNTGHYNTGVSLKGGGFWEEMAKGTYKDGKYTPHFDTRVSMKGGAEMAKYDDTRMPKYDESRMGIYDNSRMGVDDNSRMGVYNAYSGGMPPQLSHPSSREMARYYGGGGSRFI